MVSGPLRTSSKVALLAVLAALAVVLAPTGAAWPDALHHPEAGAAGEFTIDSLVTEATLASDGSLAVTEIITYDFGGGPFSVGIRSFERSRDQVVEFTASDDTGPLEVVPPDQTPTGEWEWLFRVPISNERTTFTLSYRVVDAVDVYADVADLLWQFVGTDHPGIGSMSVVVTTPGSIPPARADTPDDDTAVVRGFAHGPTSGVVEVAESTVAATVNDVPAGQFVELRVVAPATAFSVAAAAAAATDGDGDGDGDGAALASILADERALLDDAERDQQRRRIGWIGTPIVALLGAVGTALLWFRHGRERRSTEVLGTYWREPLDDPPAVAAANLRRGTVDPGRTIAGTLVDLAQRGYIQIVAEHEQRLGPDQTVHRYRWVGRPLGPDIIPYERAVIEMIFRGASEVTSSEVQAWASGHRTQARPMLDSITAGVTAELRNRGYVDTTHRHGRALLAAVCGATIIVSLLLLAVSGNGIAFLGVGVGVALFVIGLRLLSNRSQAGAEAAAKAEGLRNYIADFSQLEDAPVGHLILWERYLVYSVALGVSAELVRNMAVRVPEVLNNPAFGAWYIGTGRHFDGFDHIEAGGASIAAASVPNSSGSGGGFSGGGGGGGGGGGFGAR